MSYLIASVLQIEYCDSLHHVRFECGEQVISMLSLELPQGVAIGSKVKLAIKASHVSIAKELSGRVSFANQLPAVIDSIVQGELLCYLRLQCANSTIESIILRKIREEMKLEEGDEISALIQASEISICEVLDD